MTVKTIKGIRDEVWVDFKTMAARNNMNAGEFFEELLSTYGKRRDKSWDVLLNSPKILTDKEAKELREFTTKIRKERGFRV